MGIVEIEGMAERAVEQRGDRRRPGLGVAEHGGVALAVERQRFQHPEQRRRRFRIAPRPDRAAEEIERQHLGALQHLRRDVLEFQIGDIGGERCGFVGHRVSSYLPRRVGGLILAFKPPSGRGHQLCPASSGTGAISRFRNASHDGLRKTHAWIAPAVRGRRRRAYGQPAT